MEMVMDEGWSVIRCKESNHRFTALNTGYISWRHVIATPCSTRSSSDHAGKSGICLIVESIRKVTRYVLYLSSALTADQERQVVSVAVHRHKLRYCHYRIVCVLHCCRRMMSAKYSMVFSSEIVVVVHNFDERLKLASGSAVLKMEARQFYL
nr:hypothetical protein CFP56_52784 [Quercus suber]